MKNFVDDYGAVAGRDSTDAWLRLETDVNAGNVKGAIFFPKGVYELRKRIELRRSNVVLRGEEGTILHFPLSLYEVYGQGHRPTPYGYMWYETFLRFK